MSLLSRRRIEEARLPVPAAHASRERYPPYSRNPIDAIFQLAALPANECDAMKAVSAMLPFLASPAPGWVTGKRMGVDGGMETTNWPL